MPLERLQKIVARAGVASRRAAEALISAGRVRVNGRVVRTLGTKADPRRDRIEVDGRRLVREEPVYVLLHKPRATVTTLRDPEGRPTVRDLLRGIPERLHPVGRLDYNTSGVLILTNDGAFTQALLHPSARLERTYAVKLQGRPGPEVLEHWRKGVRLSDGVTAPARVFILSQGPTATWIQVTIREGRNRQIHRMAEATGHRVQRLKRLAFGGLDVEDLRPGEHRLLGPREVRALLQRAGGQLQEGSPERTGAGTRPRRRLRPGSRPRPDPRPRSRTGSGR